MLNVFMPLIEQATRVQVFQCGEFADFDFRRNIACWELSPLTGAPDNEVVRLVVGAEVFKLTEEGLTNATFSGHTLCFEVADSEGDVLRIRLVGEDVMTPPDMEEPTEMVFLVIQEGGSSTELYVHAHYSLEDAVIDQQSCWEDGAYRTSDVVEVPAALAAQPGFYEAAEALIRATMTLQGRG